MKWGKSADVEAPADRWRLAERASRRQTEECLPLTPQSCCRLELLWAKAREERLALEFKLA